MESDSKFPKATEKRTVGIVAYWRPTPRIKHPGRPVLISITENLQMCTSSTARSMSSQLFGVSYLERETNLHTALGVQ